jgi:hypothetical protein
MREDNAASIELLLENKREYIDHLQEVLADAVVAEVGVLYDGLVAKRSPRILEDFQRELQDLAKWNVDRVRALKESVVARTHCTYLPDLLKAVFVVSAQLHVSTTKCVGGKQEKIKIRVPTLEVFVHHCATEFARQIWKRPYLFYHAVRSLERQKNLVQCNRIMRKAILTTLRKSMPMNDILASLARHEPATAAPEAAMSDVESSETESEAMEEAEEANDSASSENETSDSEMESEDEVLEQEAKDMYMLDKVDEAVVADKATETETETEVEETPDVEEAETEGTPEEADVAAESDQEPTQGDVTLLRDEDEDEDELDDEGEVQSAAPPTVASAIGLIKRIDLEDFPRRAPGRGGVRKVVRRGRLTDSFF